MTIALIPGSIGVTAKTQRELNALAHRHQFESVEPRTEELASLPAGSRVTFTARQLDGGDKPELLVELSDNGPGIPEEALRVLFDPFVVRSDTPSEYGIHLMACYFIVFHHGGQIAAESDPGRGTTFTLRLPLHPEPAAKPADDQDFLRKVLLNESVWQKLISSD